MAYETKVILIAIAEIIRNTRNVEQIYQAIADMANAEGVILKPLDEPEEEKK